MTRLLERALDFYGLTEIPGVENNPIIMDFFREIGHTWVQGDETAWCSAFVNYIAKTEGYEYSGKLDARSWLDTIVKVDTPFRGCLVILWRVDPSSWQGHVGWWINEDNAFIYIYGGNQNNQCRVTPYPKNQLLAYGILKQRR